jgi:hypothetical protein
MKRTFLTIATAALIACSAFAAPMKGSWAGWVSDAKCGASKIDAACVKECEAGGSPLVFVSDKDKSVLQVSNQDMLKGHEGHHVKVKGTVDGETLTITSVAMMKDQTMGGMDMKK